MARTFMQDAAIHIMAALMANTDPDNDYPAGRLARLSWDAAEVLDCQRRKRQAECDAQQRGGAELVHGD